MAAPVVNNIQSVTSSLTLSYTVPSVTDGRLVVMVGKEDVGNNNPITGVTFGAAALTVDADAVSVLGSNSNRMAIYSLASPTAGTDTITIVTSNERIGIIAFTLSDCGAVTASDTDVITSSGSTMTTNVTTVGADNIVVSCTNNSTTSATTNPAGTTSIANIVAAATVRFQSFYEDAASAGLVSSTATGFDIRSAMATVSYAASAGGGAFDITPETGSFSYSGGDIALTVGRSITPETGVFSYSGGDVGFTYTPLALSITPETGVFSYSGGDIALTVQRGVTPESGVFSYSGSDIDLSVGRVITPESGVFSYSGGDVSFTYTPSGSFTITPETGVFSYIGGDLSFTYTRGFVSVEGKNVISVQKTNKNRIDIQKRGNTVKIGRKSNKIFIN